MSISLDLALGCLIIGTLVWLLLEEVILVIIPDEQKLPMEGQPPKLS